MDRVRFGRALGKGARAAARTAVEAIEAASAPSTTARQATPSGSPARPSPRPATPRSTILPPTPSAPQVTAAARAAVANTSAPFRAASRALWHEFTGSFFALFALPFVIGAWHTRAYAVSAIAAERYRFYAFCALAVLFAYFSVSSFLRAKKR